MNKSNSARRQSKWLAGAVATLANVLLFAAVLGLAEHYARTAADVRIEAGALAQQAVTPSRNS